MVVLGRCGKQITEMTRYDVSFTRLAQTFAATVCIYNLRLKNVLRIIHDNILEISTISSKATIWGIYLVPIPKSHLTFGSGTV